MVQVKVQSGPRNARTDPESGLRFYTWQGVELPSVTSIRRMAGLPHGLHQWAIGKIVDHAITNAEDIADRLADAVTPGIEKVVRQELRRAATAERDKAAALGTAVHDAAATAKHPDEVAAELRPRLLQYMHWLETADVDVLGSEFQVWNLEVGYAGTADLLVRFPNGAVWLVDLKTGKGVWPEHALQLIAYKRATFVGADDVVDERLTALLRETRGMAILHLADDGWEFRAIRDDADTWRAFRGLLLFSTWLFSHATPDAVTIGTRAGVAQ